MKIGSLLEEEAIIFEKDTMTKNQALNMLIDKMYDLGYVDNYEVFRSDVYAREEVSSTGMSNGIAIPHAKSEGVSEPHLACLIVEEGLDFESLDGEKTHLVFLIAATKESDTYLEILSSLAELLTDKDFANDLIKASNPRDFLAVIERAEYRGSTLENGTVEEPRIVAVTACPTGLAHTYMARKALVDAGEKLGIPIKVETRGSKGIENDLTRSDIEGADAVILASDISLDMERFSGKKIIKVSTRKAIEIAEDLLKSGISSKELVLEEETMRSQILSNVYQALMTGFAHMLPFIVGGGFLAAVSHLLPNPEISEFLAGVGDLAFRALIPVMAAFTSATLVGRPGFLHGFVGGLIVMVGGAGFFAGILMGLIVPLIISALDKVFGFLPKHLESLKPSLIFPVLGLILTAMAAYFISRPLSLVNIEIHQFLLTAKGPRSIFLCIVMGVLMTADFGGPLNKITYMLAISTLTYGSSVIMSGAMIGGMIPPLITALAPYTSRFYFTDEDRASFSKSALLSMAFVTEGAVDLVKKYSKVLYPACLVGAGVGGGLASILRVRQMVPHGGVFILPVLDNPLGFLAAYLGGVIVGLIAVQVMVMRKV